MQDIFKQNNFNILRLIAAFQVAFVHTSYHLGLDFDSLRIFALLKLFPGVPIFFFISGFLISKSYENNPHLKEYSSNRVLRIFPALIVCILVTLFSISVTGYFKKVSINYLEFSAWVLAQMSFFQFYNPEFMRNFGVGVMNGSLWTISVELQFYILTPILFRLFSLSNNKKSNFYLPLLISIFLIFNIAYFYFKFDISNKIEHKLIGVSFLPWIWMFLVGVFFQKNFELFHRLASRISIYVLVLYLLISYFFINYLSVRTGNGINPLLFILLSITVFSLAYSAPDLSNSLLKNNDFSYGVYIYHMPVVNIFLYYGISSNKIYGVAVIVITIMLAGLSWRLIEKPSLKLKKHPLNPLK